MFIEPTIVRVPSGFAGYTMAQYNNCVSTKGVYKRMNLTKDGVR